MTERNLEQTESPAPAPRIAVQFDANVPSQTQQSSASADSILPKATIAEGSINFTMPHGMHPSERPGSLRQPTPLITREPVSIPGPTDSLGRPIKPSNSAPGSWERPNDGLNRPPMVINPNDGLNRFPNNIRPNGGFDRFPNNRPPMMVPPIDSNNRPPTAVPKPIGGDTRTPGNRVPIDRDIMTPGNRFLPWPIDGDKKPPENVPLPWPIDGDKKPPGYGPLPWPIDGDKKPPGYGPLPWPIDGDKTPPNYEPQPWPIDGDKKPLGIQPWPIDGDKTPPGLRPGSIDHIPYAGSNPENKDVLSGSHDKDTSNLLDYLNDLTIRNEASNDPDLLKNIGKYLNQQKEAREDLARQSLHAARNRAVAYS